MFLKGLTKFYKSCFRIIRMSLKEFSNEFKGELVEGLTELLISDLKKVHKEIVSGYDDTLIPGDNDYPTIIEPRLL